MPYARVETEQPMIILFCFIVLDILAALEFYGHLRPNDEHTTSSHFVTLSVKRAACMVVFWQRWNFWKNAKMLSQHFKFRFYSCLSVFLTLHDSFPFQHPRWSRMRATPSVRTGGGWAVWSLRWSRASHLSASARNVSSVRRWTDECGRTRRNILISSLRRRKTSADRWGWRNDSESFENRWKVEGREPTNADEDTKWCGGSNDLIFRSF